MNLKYYLSKMKKYLVCKLSTESLIFSSRCKNVFVGYMRHFVLICVTSVIVSDNNRIFL